MIAWLVFTVPFVLLATFVGSELPTLGGAVVGGAIYVAVVIARRLTWWWSRWCW